MAGYRSYLIAALMAAASAALGLGYIDRVVYETIMGILLGGGVASLRAAVTNETQAVAKKVPAAVTKAVAQEVPEAMAEAVVVVHEVPRAAAEPQNRDPATGQFR